MDTGSQRQKLETAFRQALALPAKVDIRSAAYDNTPQWDSVAHLLLVGALEDAFGIHLTPAEVVELNSYAQAQLILTAHGVRLDE